MIVKCFIRNTFYFNLSVKRDPKPTCNLLNCRLLFCFYLTDKNRLALLQLAPAGNYWTVTMATSEQTCCDVPILYSTKHSFLGNDFISTTLCWKFVTVSRDNGRTLTNFLKVNIQIIPTMQLGKSRRAFHFKKYPLE